MLNLRFFVISRVIPEMVFALLSQEHLMLFIALLPTPTTSDDESPKALGLGISTFHKMASGLQFAEVKKKNPSSISDLQAIIL